MHRLLLAASLALLGTAAHASDGVYVGAGVSRANIDNIFGSGFNLDPHDASWTAIAGFRPIDQFAVEANYMNLGNESKEFGLGSARADAKAFAAYGVGFLPLPLPLPTVDLFAKAGLARWQLDGNLNGGGQLFAFDNRGTQFAYGAGAQANFGPLAARMEYNGFQIKHTDGVSVYTLGLTWTFL